MKNQTVVLITGCSSGIGKELCEILYDQGYTVVATARNVETIKTLKASLKLSLDVTKREFITGAVREVLSRYRKIDVLVNNAGYSVRGALEEVDVSDVKTMYDVNVFGMIQMIQTVVPIMRNQQSGKIINIGSISGQFAQAINGAYCSSKFAVEALNEALRLELHQYHIQSTVIEPGAIKTNFFKTLAQNSADLMSNLNSPYARHYESDTRQRMTQKKAEAKEVARIIAKIMAKSRLKVRYKVAVPLKFRLVAALPDSLKEKLLRRC
ncbi:SDR family oxidoreductase [Bacillus sp. CLL-7-23]|uniref:SDR family oxidoreductase n=1 Tax=Bacillus changyiensis TaxID=3004103 RepID=A0ABT4X346_9BACI|nr:SDR family oxidoreductase [Bacillus changyiensis]MDA7026679.1 SDR family oxidoreductase [Bacillus changyiensis]